MIRLQLFVATLLLAVATPALRAGLVLIAGAELVGVFARRMLDRALTRSLGAQRSSPDDERRRRLS